MIRLGSVAAPFSVLVPVYNEASILEDTVARIVAELRSIGTPFELLICENGSTDASPSIARLLDRRYSEITIAHLPDADYGLALKHGIAACRHECIVIFNLDFWSSGFAREAVCRLQSCDVVLGSKVMRGASDRRPIVRRLITRCFNSFLRQVVGFRGTDTHGMKALRQSAVIPIAGECVTDGWLFDTELILRAERQGLRIVEIPVNVEEIRPPRHGSIAKRFPRVLFSLFILWRALRHVQRMPVAGPRATPRASQPK